MHLNSSVEIFIPWKLCHLFPNFPAPLRLGAIRAALLVAEAQRISRVSGEIAGMAQKGAMTAGEASIEALLQDLGNKGLSHSPDMQLKGLDGARMNAYIC